jgi:hypothetical protein
MPYLPGNCSMRYSTSYIPVVVHGPDRFLDLSAPGLTFSLQS